MTFLEGQKENIIFKTFTPSLLKLFLFINGEKKYEINHCCSFIIILLSSVSVTT